MNTGTGEDDEQKAVLRLPYQEVEPNSVKCIFEESGIDVVFVANARDREGAREGLRRRYRLRLRAHAPLHRASLVFESERLIDK